MPLQRISQSFHVAFQPFFYANIREEGLLVEALSCVKAERGPA